MKIRIVNLRKSLGDQAVLRGVDLEIPRGKITAIIGRSSGGKSILLKHLIGLIRPDSGEIWVDGEEITSLTRRALSRVKTRFGFLFQGAALFDSMTVFENIAFPLREKTERTDSGIKPGAPVEIAGVGIGKVEQILLHEGRARVALKIDDQVTLQEDVFASIKSTGIIGDKFVSLSPGGSERLLKPDDVIRSTESAVPLEDLISQFIHGKVE